MTVFCFCRSSQCKSIIFGQVHRILKSSERFTPKTSPSFLSSAFLAFLAVVASTTTAATFISSSESATNHHHHKMSRQFSENCFCNKYESVCKYCSQTLVPYNIHEDRSDVKNMLKGWLSVQTFDQVFYSQPLSTKKLEKALGKETWGFTSTETIKAY